MLWGRSPKLAEALTLMGLRGKPVSEAAQLVKVPAGTAGSRSSRARDHAQASLAGSVSLKRPGRRRREPYMVAGVRKI
jgi:DNA-directed RNA polymerase specialized sigma24 family protein